MHTFNSVFNKCVRSIAEKIIEKRTNTIAIKPIIDYDRTGYPAETEGGMRKYTK